MSTRRVAGKTLRAVKLLQIRQRLGLRRASGVSTERCNVRRTHQDGDSVQVRNALEPCVLRARGVGAQPCVRRSKRANTPRRRGTGCLPRHVGRPALGAGRDALEACQQAAVQRDDELPRACRRAPGPAPAPASVPALWLCAERGRERAANSESSPYGRRTYNRTYDAFRRCVTYVLQALGGAHHTSAVPQTDDAATWRVAAGSRVHRYTPPALPDLRRTAARRQTRCNSCKRRCCVACGYSRATRCARCCCTCARQFILACR